MSYINVLFNWGITFRDTQNCMFDVSAGKINFLAAVIKKINQPQSLYRILHHIN